jgi:anti-anti-sigma factor
MSVCQLKPFGIIDAAGSQFMLDRIQSEVGTGNRTVLIDFAGVESVDDQGLELLLQGLKAIADAGGQSCLYALNKDVRSLFVARGLDMVLNILP